MGDKQGDGRGLRADSERHREDDGHGGLGKEGAWQVLRRVENRGAR